LGMKGGKKKNLVIHICGPSGSGKTTLGNKLKETFSNKIVVKDIDDLRAEFVLKFYGGYDKFWKNKYKWNEEEYQKYIDKFVNKQTKPLVFVGLNHMPWWNKNLYYDVHADYKFYIELDSDTIFKQKCSRIFDDFFVKERDIVLNDIMKDEKGAIKRINDTLKGECGYNEIKNMNKIWNRDYKTQGYNFMSRENIFKEVSKIIKTKYVSLTKQLGGNIDDVIEIAKKFNENGVHGGILITQNNKTLYEKYFNNTKESQFRIFSCTKPIAGLAILLLIDQGLLSITDTLDKFKIKIPNANKITILHLLDQQSGIFDVVNSIYFERKPLELFNKIYKPNENRTEVLEFEQYIEIINKNKPQNEPGEKRIYNNTAYDILGYIVYLVSGMKTTKYIKKNIFKPLGMNDSTFHTHKLHREVLPYEPGDKIGVREQYNFFGLNANIIATLRDYDKFLNGYDSLLSHITREIYEKLYYFQKFQSSDKLNTTNVLTHIGGGDFSHEYAENGGKYNSLCKTFMAKFLKENVNLIVHQNNKESVDFLNFNEESNFRLLVDNLIKL